MKAAEDAEELDSEIKNQQSRFKDAAAVEEAAPQALLVLSVGQGLWNALAAAYKGKCH